MKIKKEQKLWWEEFKAKDPEAYDYAKWVTLRHMSG